MIALLSIAVAHAESLDALLARGEVTLLETRADGRLKQATAIGLVRAPIERVWAQLTDFPSYVGWMPTVHRSEVLVTEGNDITVGWTLSVVGPDIVYSALYRLDPAAHTIHGTWVEGALPGSHWEWRLEAKGGDTVVYRTVYTNVVDTNWVVKQIEDDNHTLDYGINVATGIIEIKGLKKALGVP